MPAAVQTPRYSEFLKRLLGFKESRAFDIEDILLAVVSVLNPAAPEYDFPRGELRACGVATAAAVAAQFSFVALENPIGSGCLLVADGYDSQGSQPTYFGLAKATGLGVSAGAVKSPNDGRGFQATNPPLIGDIRTGSDVNNPAVAGNGFGFAVISGSQAFQRVPPFVIPPGWTLVVKDNTVNTAFSVSITWRIKFGLDVPELGGQ